MPPYARATALWRNSSESLRFMDPPLDLVTLALLIKMQSLPPQQPVEAFPGHAPQSHCQLDLLVLLLSSCHLDHHHHLTLHSTTCSYCILSPPTHGPGSHPPDEERPLSWSLLQLWQTRPHHEGLPMTTHSECLEHQCYDDSETCSQGLAVPHGIY